MTIEIPKAVLQAIQDHAREAYPEECCGFLIGHSSAPRRVVESRRARNVATENRSRRYMVDPLELLRVDDDVRKKNLDLIGIYHSHPDHPAAPSEYDRSRAASWLSYVIASIVDQHPKDVTAWQFDEAPDRSDPKRLSIVEPRPASPPDALSRDSDAQHPRDEP